MSDDLDRLDGLLNEKQAAAYFGASSKTLQSWRFKRTGPPYYKIRGFVRYDLEDLRVYVKNRKVSI